MCARNSLELFWNMETSGLDVFPLLLGEAQSGRCHDSNKAIRSDLLAHNSAPWCQIVPGRLLWVRATIRGQQWDIINLYQVSNAGMDGETKTHRLQERRAIWNKLEKLVRSVPLRSMLAVCGDFNLSMEALPPVAGFGARPSAVDRDILEERRRVMNIFRQARMVFLNTWSGKQATYEHPTGDTQIDYVVVRQQVADNKRAPWI